MDLRPALALLCLGLSACAGYRGGWESLPYVDAPPPPRPEARTAQEVRERSELRLPGITLGVGINNRARSYDTQVYLFVLPLAIDPRTVQPQVLDPGKTRITLRVSGTAGDFVLRPHLARLSVGGKTVSPVASFEFGMWDASGQRVASGGAWAHRPLPDEFPLVDASRTYLLSLDFPLPPPSPEDAQIVLDLGAALQAPGKPEIPPIRFQPARWTEGYT